MNHTQTFIIILALVLGTFAVKPLEKVDYNYTKFTVSDKGNLNMSAEELESNLMENVVLVHAVNFSDGNGKNRLVLEKKGENYIYYKDIIDDDARRVFYKSDKVLRHVEVENPNNELAEDLFTHKARFNGYIHCNWGRLVLPHANGDWGVSRVAFLTPLKAQVGRIVRLFPCDTPILDYLELTSDSVVVGDEDSLKKLNLWDFDPANVEYGRIIKHKQTSLNLFIMTSSDNLRNSIDQAMSLKYKSYYVNLHLTAQKIEKSKITREYYKKIRESGSGKSILLNLHYPLVLKYMMGLDHLKEFIHKENSTGYKTSETYFSDETEQKDYLTTPIGFFEFLEKLDANEPQGYLDAVRDLDYDSFFEYSQFAQILCERLMGTKQENLKDLKLRFRFHKFIDNWNESVREFNENKCHGEYDNCELKYYPTLSYESMIALVQNNNFSLFGHFYTLFSELVRKSTNDFNPYHSFVENRNADGLSFIDIFQLLFVHKPGENFEIPRDNLKGNELTRFAFIKSMIWKSLDRKYFPFNSNFINLVKTMIGYYENYTVYKFLGELSPPECRKKGNLDCILHPKDNSDFTMTKNLLNYFFDLKRRGPINVSILPETFSKFVKIAKGFVNWKLQDFTLPDLFESLNEHFRHFSCEFKFNSTRLGTKKSPSNDDCGFLFNKDAKYMDFEDAELNDSIILSESLINTKTTPQSYCVFRGNFQGVFLFGIMTLENGYRLVMDSEAEFYWDLKLDIMDCVVDSGLIEFNLLSKDTKKLADNFSSSMQDVVRGMIPSHGKFKLRTNAFYSRVLKHLGNGDLQKYKEEVMQGQDNYDKDFHKSFVMSLDEMNMDSLFGKPPNIPFQFEINSAKYCDYYRPWFHLFESLFPTDKLAWIKENQQIHDFTFHCSDAEDFAIKVLSNGLLFDYNDLINYPFTVIDMENIKENSLRSIIRTIESHLRELVESEIIKSPVDIDSKKSEEIKNFLKKFINCSPSQCKIIKLSDPPINTIWLEILSSTCQQ